LLLHRYARAADLVSAALLLLAAWLALVGINRHLVFDRVLAPPSASLVLYAALSIQIVRHVLWPRPTAWARLTVLRARVMARPDVAAAVHAFLGTRIAVFLVAFFAVLTIGLGPKPGFILSREPLDNLPARFDAGWYGGIALDGYTWDHTFQRQRNIAFFPALPMLMRPVGVLFGMNDRTVPRERRMLRALWAGVVISLAAFLWALYYVARLTADMVGADYAESATLLVAAYPFALYYNAPYTESLFLLGAVGAAYHFLRGEWIASSAFGLLVGLTRPNGCFLSIPLGILALQQFARTWPVASDPGSRIPGPGRAAVPSFVTASMPGIGMLIFTLYLYRLTGVWFAWARSHEAWGRTYKGLDPFVTAFGWLWNEPFLQVVGNIPFNVLNAIGLIFALALTYPVCRRLGLAWGVFVLVNVVPPLFAGGVLSMGRFTATLFPLFIALAAVVPRRNVPSWVAAFAVGQGLCATLFFTWRELF
jgi:mannosyltransferase PIG-V